MAWRKWLVRSLVFLVAAGVTAAGWAYQHWTNPAAVRAQVLAKLGEYLPGARVSLESAHLRLLGGISVTELRLGGRDGSDPSDLAHFPSGTIYHDKEELLSGRMVIKKIEFARAVLHVTRRLDGTWSLDRSILARQDLRVAVPMIVLQQATVLIDDQQHASGLPPIQVNDVNLTIRNDPRPTLVFEGSGNAPLLGRVHVTGKLGRSTGEFQAALQLLDVPINGDLTQRLAAYCPDTAAHLRQLTGAGELQLELNYEPNSPRPCSYDARVSISHGTLRHAQIPMTLENLEARARCVDGQLTVESVTAQAGDTTCKLTHLTMTCDPDSDVDGRLQFQHLPASEALFTALPARLHAIRDDYHPQGTFTIDVDFHRRSGQWREHAVIQPEDVTAGYEKFPYALEHLRGKIDQEFDPARSINRVQVDLVGFAGTQAVYVQGKVDVKPLAIDLHIWGRNIALDQKLQAALQPEFQKIAGAFNVSGFADLDILIHRDPGAERCANRYVIDLHDAGVRYEVFPYPLESVTGTLDIQPDHWEVRRFHAAHKGGEFHGSGGSDPRDPRRMVLEITGSNILLDAELEAALKQPGLKTAWTKLAPQGRINFAAHVDQVKGQEPDISVEVTPLGCSVRPQFFPYELADIRGLVRFQHQIVHLQKIVAYHGPTVLQLEEAKVQLRPDGGVSLDLVNVGGSTIVPDEDLYRALPKLLGDACAMLRLKQPLAMFTNMTIDVPGDGSPPYIYWDGGLRLNKATLHAGVDLTQVSGAIHCRGQFQGGFGVVSGNIAFQEATVFQQTLHHIQATIAVSDKTPNALDLVNLKCQLYGGDVTGKAHLDFAATPRYMIDLTGSQLQLQEFARLNDLGKNAHMSGPAGARLYLQGEGLGIEGLRGGGTIDVPDGKISNLPPLLDLLKVLNLRLPDRTAFEEARMRFSITGPVVTFDQLDLFGNSISLSGRGTMKIDGTELNLDFYSFWGRIMQWSPPIIDKMWPALSKGLLKIKLRGTLSQRTVTKEPVPILTEPVKEFLKRVNGVRG